ncbi:MAG: NADH-ubiquinone oxidoreductase-F iron-sulfur binding region domain-containing protein [Oscillospiraceae bacterium]|nr:NADH-ubiquinone oxidoreductase-F iron-sulfur binding region domain-containing protein [Oscillospiraceae bacterium]
MQNKSLTLEWVSRHYDKIDPLSIDEYINAGGYESLKKALGMSGDAIISEVKASGLRGRGGAAFPTGLKLAGVKKSAGNIKYLICNADEGEPGNFKDRYQMEKDPHSMIEGMIIAAFAVGAAKGYIFIRGEYDRSIDTVKKALQQAREKGLLGENILGSGFSYDMEVLTGGGSYVCGEEFSLIECLEGKAGHSNYKPPFPTEQGLFGKPTLLSNVETFVNILLIMDKGAEEFSKTGTEGSKGTKMISLCGNVNRPGLYEVPYGVTIRDIIFELGGGVPEGRVIKMVQLGGESGPCIPESELDTPLDYKEMNEKGLSFGSGAVIVMDERIDILDILKKIAKFFLHESCGKCTPCRDGNPHVLILLKRFESGSATEKDLAALTSLSDTMCLASTCGLGQAATTAIRSVMKYFPETFATVSDQ